jgi:hypothetical protein
MCQYKILHRIRKNVEWVILQNKPHVFLLVNPHFPSLVWASLLPPPHQILLQTFPAAAPPMPVHPIPPGGHPPCSHRHRPGTSARRPIRQDPHALLRVAHPRRAQRLLPHLCAP